MHDAPWDAEAVNSQRLQLWQAHPYLGPHSAGVLILDETGDPKRGHRIELAAQQYLGKLGQVASARGRGHQSTCRMAPGMCRSGSNPLDQPVVWRRRKQTGAFHTKPDLAWTLIKEAREAGIPFRLVVADCVSGENARLEGRLFAARIPSIMGLRPSHGTWQWVEDPKHRSRLHPSRSRESASPKRPGSALCAGTSHGKELVRYVAELELGNAYGPTCGIRLVAATLDPSKLDPDNTWSSFDLLVHERGEYRTGV